ncbi:MAG: flagellar brake protein [Lachnospiraceae bacterium]|nr:flagellar brake protein [Lachnospiraceae bacterium]
MLSKFITLGDRVELTAVGRVKLTEEEEKRTYQSKVYEILTDDTLEITMPMEKTKLILLPVDGEYDMVFYTDTGLYQCFARIADRYKSNNVYILRVELTSNLRKYQRREYYRFSCALEMCSRNLEEEEQQALEGRKPYVLQPGLPLKKSVIVDISGGGLRFMSTQQYDPGSLLYCSYHLVKGGVSKQYEVVGKVLSVKPVENRPGTYEHRVQYYNMDTATREEIIRFIFEEERKSRQKKN